MSKAIHMSGKRKKAVARATLTAGSGKVSINRVKLEHIHPALVRMRMMEPLLLAGEDAKNVNISVKVEGGGISGQADATRLAIARVLSEHVKGDKLKKVFLEYDRMLVVADVRRNETSKPNDSKPRAKRQKSYR